MDIYQIFDRYINYIISLLQHSIQGYNLATTTRLDKKKIILGYQIFHMELYIRSPFDGVCLKNCLHGEPLSVMYLHTTSSQYQLFTRFASIRCYISWLDYTANNISTYIWHITHPLYISLSCVTIKLNSGTTRKLHARMLTGKITLKTSSHTAVSRHTFPPVCIPAVTRRRAPNLIQNSYLSAISTRNDKLHFN